LSSSLKLLDRRLTDPVEPEIDLDEAIALLQSSLPLPP
jgi:hypothetical protein